MHATPESIYRKAIGILRLSSIVLFFAIIAACSNGGNDGVDANEEGQASNALSAPSGLQAQVMDASSIQLSWSDNSDNEEGFEIQQADDGADFNASYTVGGDSTTYTVDGLTEGVDYSFRVRAFNNDGDSEFSGIVVSVISSILVRDYSGLLQLRFTNAFPDIDKTTQVDVYLNRYGGFTFGTGSLSYDAIEDNGQIRIQRTGSLLIAPQDGFLDNADPALIVELDENTSFEETIKTWYKDNMGNWIPVPDGEQTFSELWNGGLAFDFDDATIGNGATVSVVTGDGSATWTLTLLPVLP